MLNDLRYAVRQLVKNPSFTVIAIFALALGIGANTAIFSVVNAVLLRPLPYPEADKLIVLRETSHIFDNGAVGYVNWLDWHAAQKSFTDLALVRRESVNFSVGVGQASPERLRGVRASSGFLSVVGVNPKLGRDLSPIDDIAGAPNVALISENLWRHDFGGSPSALGRRVLIDGLQREIIGVLPTELQFGRNPDVLLPLSEIAKEPWMLKRDYHQGWSALGRLKPGVTISQATSDLNAIAVDLEKKYPQSNAGRRVRLRPLFETTVGDYRGSLNLLIAAVLCVLLIACGNVANLQFARALARGREIAVRAALGASRWSIARQLLVESTLIALVGAVAGVLLTVWCMDAILALTPPNVPRFHETRIDLHVLGFTTFAAMLAGVLVGVWPAWRISHSESISLALHEAGGRGSSDGLNRQRMRSGLVVMQAALTIVLLAGAGLTLKSFWHAQNAPLGFDPHGVVNFELSLPMAKYKTGEQRSAFWAQLLQRVQNIPRVEAAAINSNSPFDDTENDNFFHVTGTPPVPADQRPTAETTLVSAVGLWSAGTGGVPVTWKKLSFSVSSNGLFEFMAAASTRGIFCTRCSSCAQNALLCSPVLYFAIGKESSKFTTPCGSKPSGAFCACQKLFNVSPAPASRTIVSAACMTTKPDRIRCLFNPSLEPRPPASCSAREMDSGCEIRQAGQTPTRTPATTAAKVVKASTCKSIFVSRNRDTFGGVSARIASMHHTVSKTPAKAPTSAINVLSTSSCRAILQRLAPSAARTAISRARASARENCRFATFAHAINSTHTTAAIRRFKLAR